MYSYDKIAKIRDHYLERFLYQHELKSLVTEKTCFKSISNPSCVDLFLTNSALSFQSTKTVSIGLKTDIVKNKPRIMNILAPGSFIGIQREFFT